MTLDFEGAMLRLGNDFSLFEEFIGFYKEDCPRLLKALRDGVAERDAEVIHQSAHSLKGLVASLGATDVASSAAALERMGRANDLSDVGEGLRNLEGDIAKFEAALENFQKSKKREGAGSK